MALRTATFLSILFVVGLARSACCAAAPQVEFSRTSSTHFEPVGLTLRRTDASSGIRYTLDGTEPTTASPLYTNALVIRGTVQVRAAAEVPPGMGPIRSETFIQLTNAPGEAQTFTSTLPILVLSTWKLAGILPDKDIPCHFSLYEPMAGTTRIAGLPTASGRATLRYPDAIRPGPMRHWTFKLQDDAGMPRVQRLMDLPAASGWQLLPPSSFDPTMIHTALRMELGRQMGLPSLRTRRVEVYLNRGGALTRNSWIGTYLMMELAGVQCAAIGGGVPDAEDDPVKVAGDYLFKTSRPDEFGTDAGFLAGGILHYFVEPTESELKSQARRRQLGHLRSYFFKFDAALSAGNPLFRDPLLGYRAFIDLTNWVDCHVLETLSGDPFAFLQSSYFLKRKSGILQRAMFSDSDRGWESKDDARDDNPRIWASDAGLFNMPFWSAIFKDRDAWQLWVDRWAIHRAGPLGLANVNGLIDHMAGEAGSVQSRQFQRWPELAPRVSYSNEIRIMKHWISNRVDWIDRQFARPPLIQPMGGDVPPGQLITLTLPEDVSTSGNARIYFTRNGTDPRPDGGKGTITAELYSGPFTVSTNVRIVARVVDDGRVQRGASVTTPWSAPTSATFVVERPRLVITEVMHHPEVPPPFVTWDASDFEFVELLNPTRQTISLLGFHLDGSVRYRFTPRSDRTQLGPGERLVLVRNRDAFAWRYPGVSAVGGQYAGGLADSERRIAIRGPLEEPVGEVHYPDDGNPMAERVGFSVVPRSEAGDETGRWRLSSRVGGSPGEAEPIQESIPMVVVNEIGVRETGYVEFYNPNEAAVDLTGWWLTDDLTNPRKRRLQDGPIVNARGYATLPLKELTVEGLGPGISSGGGELWLLAGTPGGELTGGYDGLRYMPGPFGTTWGRRVSADGSVVGLGLTQTTPGAANAPFRVGPIIIAEVHLAPSAAALRAGFDDSFVELHNLSNRTIPLEDVGLPGATLSIVGDIQFHSPRGGALAPGGSLVITAFDPEGDPYSRASFLELHGRGEPITLAGPWRRRNSSGTGSLRLEWSKRIDGTTDEFEAQRFVELAPLSEIHRHLAIHGSSGSSLVRKLPAAVADDASGWAVASPTPGAVDADLDGLADGWEVLHRLDPTSGAGDDGSGGDPDADGFSNEMEAYNRTDPRDPADHLRAVPLPGSGPGELLLTWAAPAGRAYAVEQRVSAGAGTWEERASGVMGADSRGVVRMAVAANSAVFFRVLLR